MLRKWKEAERADDEWCKKENSGGWQNVRTMPRFGEKFLNFFHFIPEQMILKFIEITFHEIDKCFLHLKFELELSL